MLFDAHLHMVDEYSQLDIKKVKEIIQDAEKSKVKYLISNSTDERTIKENIELLKKFPNVCIAIGIFPTEFKTEKDLERINFVKRTLNNIKEKKLLDRIIIGEIGLDFKDEKSNKEVQIKAFKELINIAKENNVFAEIHSRFAIKQTILLLEEIKYKKIIMHWFLDSKKYIDRAVKEGYFITVGPKYLYDENIFDNIKDVPKEQILFETDYPAIVSKKPHLPGTIKDIFNKYCKDAKITKKEMDKVLDKSFNKIFPNIKINI